MEQNDNGRARGQSVIEILVVTAILLILVAGSAPLVSGVFRGQLRTTKRAEARALAQEGLDAVRSIRDADWANLDDGMHGLTHNGAFWDFSDASDTVGEYTRSVTVSTMTREGDLCTRPGSGVAEDPDAKRVAVEVHWQSDTGQKNAVTATTFFHNWRNPQKRSCSFVPPEADSFSVDTTGAVIGGLGSRELQGVIFENTGTEGIVIERMIVSWIGALPGTNMVRVTIDGDSVWSQAANSGDEIDISDFTVSAGAGSFTVDSIVFSRNMTGVTFEMVFLLADGSQKTVSDIQP